MSENNNTIITKKPPYIETVGAQYYSFNTPDEGVDYDVTKFGNVVKAETVVNVTVTENAETTPIYSSGKVYDTRNQIAYEDIEVEQLASDIDDMSKMRGDIIDESGLIQAKTSPKRPFFAYGKVVELSNGNKRFDWYPKCQLIENSDEASTREEGFEQQNETVTIRAYAFDEEGRTVKNSIHTASSKFPEGVTEDLFFSKVIVTAQDLTEITPAGV